jgi:1-acyl-sn-glycerol-3-phosphate acyltransferase
VKEATLALPTPRGASHTVRRFLPALLTSLLAYPLIVLWTLFGILVLFPLFFPLLWLVGRRPKAWVMRWLVWVYGRGWLVLMSPFVRFSRDGVERLGATGPAIVAANHLSFFDTFIMALLPVHDVAFAVRSWPFRMPWYRWFMLLAGYPDVERSDWPTTLAAAKRIFASGSFFLFFPEGHRSRDGEIHRFHTGAFKIAIETGVPVIPLCITGTDVFLPPGRLLLHPARVRLRVLEPIDPAPFRGPTAHRDLARAVKDAIADALAV